MEINKKITKWKFILYMAEKLYSLGSQYLLGVHIPKNNPFATI